MSAAAEIRPHVFDDNLARRNARVLAVAQALAGGNNTVIVSTGAIVGSMLAPDKSLATLPVMGMVVGMWCGSLPLGYLARTIGRRNALQVGSLFGVTSGIVSCTAVIQQSFVLFILGTFIAGLYAAAHLSYRFAAADTASERYRAKAISIVLAGGVFAGLLGPQLVIFTKDLLPPYLFAASYIGQSVCAAIAACVLFFVKVPPKQTHAVQSTKPLRDIITTPRFIVAAVCGIISYTTMNVVMTSAPLAMVGCGHSVTDAALGIQWHVIGMYAPSFFTGMLVARFGVERVTGFGLILIAISAAIGMAGLSVGHFWGSLALQGVGWNLTFIGATTMVTQCHGPGERNKVQSFNDFLIFGSMAISAFSSGQVLALFGWEAINEVVFPMVLVPVAMLIWLVLRQRSEAAARAV